MTEPQLDDLARIAQRRYDRQKECAESSVGHIFGEDYVCRKCSFDAYSSYTKVADGKPDE